MPDPLYPQYNILNQIPRHVRLAYELGRNAFLNGWTICPYDPPRLRIAWNQGWQDESDAA
jgi:hypothetical protein